MVLHSMIVWSYGSPKYFLQYNNYAQGAKKRHIMETCLCPQHYRYTIEAVTKLSFNASSSPPDTKLILTLVSTSKDTAAPLLGPCTCTTHASQGSMQVREACKSGGQARSMQVRGACKSGGQASQGSMQGACKSGGHVSQGGMQSDGNNTQLVKNN